MSQRVLILMPHVGHHAQSRTEEIQLPYSRHDPTRNTNQQVPIHELRVEG
jgi:hypothetical protein